MKSPNSRFTKGRSTRSGARFLSLINKNKVFNLSPPNSLINLPEELRKRFQKCFGVDVMTHGNDSAKPAHVMRLKQTPQLGDAERPCPSSSGRTFVLSAQVDFRCSAGQFDDGLLPVSPHHQNGPHPCGSIFCLRPGQIAAQQEALALIRPHAYAV